MCDLLKSHLHEASSRPFLRPQDDCCFFVVDWVLAKTGHDLAPDLRGAYVTAREAARLVVGMGGFVKMWSDRMSGAGFDTTDSPVTGDVAVIRDVVGSECAAIRVGSLWAGKAPSGLIYQDFEVLRAWSLTRG